MRLLVTGCAGFIGAKTCELLLDEGNEIVGVDSLNDAYDPKLKHWRLSRLKERDGFTMLQLNIDDASALAAIPKPEALDAVVNLAARAGVRPSVEMPSVYYQTNVLGTLNLLELCREQGIKKFLLASTSSLYGEGERPFVEDAPTDRVLSPYAASKKAAEVLCYTYHKLHGIDVTIPRYFTVYGPAGRPDMSIFRFIKWIAEGETLQLSGDGSQERDFTYVEDIARGTIAGLTPLGFEIINLGNDNPAPLMSVINRIEALLDRKSKIQREPMHPADVSATWANITKAKKMLRWQPEVGLDEGIRRTVDWYIEHREWASEVKL